MPVLHLSVRVGDAAEGILVEELERDLAASVHADAVQHFGRSSGCQVVGFHRDGGTDAGRGAFEARLLALGVGVDDRATYLGEWDGFTRPVAIIHWTKAGD